MALGAAVPLLVSMVLLLCHVGSCAFKKFVFLSDHMTGRGLYDIRTI